MAILVDAARWPWRDTFWCHLVSDSHLSELHEFAGHLGCRRVGFQGDHYDIDIETRALAVELGAEQCTSRELVGRLKSAGLRLRPSSFEKWQLQARWDGPFDPSAIVDATMALRSDQHDLIRSVEATSVGGGFALGRNGTTAAVLFGADDPPGIEEDAGDGRYCRVDVRGNWSLELLHPPLPDTD